MGSLVRESVAMYLAGTSEEEDPIAGIVALFEDAGPRPHGDVGEEHDAYLADVSGAPGASTGPGVPDGSDASHGSVAPGSTPAARKRPRGRPR